VPPSLPCFRAARCGRLLPPPAVVATPEAARKLPGLTKEAEVLLGGVLCGVVQDDAAGGAHLAEIRVTAQQGMRKARGRPRSEVRFSG
jgi:hypothetical protein